MASEREKMLAGELYDALDPELGAGRERSRDLCRALNATREGEAEARRTILRALFGRGRDTVSVQPPFFCDFGAGSVVTRDVPDGVFAAGNSCRVIREISE